MAKAKKIIQSEDTVVPRLVWDYDIEQFMNFFLVIFKEVNTKQKRYFIIYSDTRNKNYSRNDTQALVTFIRTEVQTLIGYNNHEYDDLMIKHILLNEEMFIHNATPEEIVASTKRLNDRIINEQPHRKQQGQKDKYLQDLKRKREFDSLDLMEMQNTVDRVSLKQIAINMRWHNIIDLPFHPDHIVTSDEIPDIIFYCENDVDITAAYREKQRPEIQYRKDLSRLYNLSVINSNNTTITKKIVQKFYCEEAGIKFDTIRDLKTNLQFVKLANCISPRIKFMTAKYQRIVSYMRNHKDIRVNPAKDQKNKKKQFEYIHDSEIMKHTVALGGMHSKNESVEFREDSEFEYEDVDVDSFYPWIIILENLFPKHLGPLFVKVYKEKIVVPRMTAKRNVKEGIDVDVNGIINDSLKNTANGTFGLTKSIHSFLYDPNMALYITVSGQLFLLMLMERIEELTDCRVVYSNTDGMTVRIPKNETSKANFHRVCKQWEEYTGFSLEHINYKRMILRDINNYLMITSDKKKEVKEKGLFVTKKKMNQAYSYPVVANALYNYYINDTPVEKYIKSQNDVYDFMAAERTSTYKYNIYFWKKDSEANEPVKLQKSNRWLVTKGNPEEGKIIKYSKTRRTNKGTVATNDMQKGRMLTIVNNTEGHTDITKEHIDYDFYILECRKVIKKISKYKGVGHQEFKQSQLSF